MRLDDGLVRAASDPAATARTGVSLVAFHGQAKPAALRGLVEEAQSRLGSALGHFAGLFRPTPLQRVHATIVGLEGIRAGGGAVNHQARARTGGAGAPMDLPGLFQSLRRRAWPLPVRFGGNPPPARNPHDPARPPWERAFDVREDGRAVLIGWPGTAREPFAPLLHHLRKDAERYGVVHKYHVDPAARDNDLFLVVGSIEAGVLKSLGDRRPDALAALARGRDEVRRRLEAHPVEVALELGHLAVVEYQSTTFERVTFERPLPDVDAAEVLALYQGDPT
jgi:hypothetical protein